MFGVEFHITLIRVPVLLAGFCNGFRQSKGTQEQIAVVEDLR